MSSSLHPPGDHHIEVGSDAATALTVAKAVAADWGAEWETAPSDTAQKETPSNDGSEGQVDLGDSGARLTIPALAGLRRGEITGRLSVEPARSGGMPSGVRLRFVVEEESYGIQTVPVMILLSAAFGCLIVLLWPFVPALASLVPFSIVLGIAAWFLVIAKLSNSGPREFLEEIAQRVETDDEG